MKLALLALLLAAALPAAAAEDFPSKPVRIIVANSPGSSPDLVARTVGAEMAKLLGQPVIVENKPGLDGIVGYELVAKQAPADGYTLASVIVSGLATLPVTVKDLRFDPLQDLPPVIGLAEGRLFVGSAANQPWKSVAELAAHAKANPGKLNFGSSGANIRLLGEGLSRSLGLEMVHVPYNGFAPYMQGMLTGEVHMGFVAEITIVTYKDRFRPLAITGDKRRAPYLDVPTFAELGYPEIPSVFFSFNVRAGTPKPIVDKLYAAASKALQAPDVKARLQKVGYDPVDQPPEEALKSLLAQNRYYADVGRRAGVRAQ